MTQRKTEIKNRLEEIEEIIKCACPADGDQAELEEAYFEQDQLYQELETL